MPISDRSEHFRCICLWSKPQAKKCLHVGVTLWKIENLCAPFVSLLLSPVNPEDPMLVLKIDCRAPDASIGTAPPLKNSPLETQVSFSPKPPMFVFHGLTRTAEKRFRKSDLSTAFFTKVSSFQSRISRTARCQPIQNESGTLNNDNVLGSHIPRVHDTVHVYYLFGQALSD